MQPEPSQRPRLYAPLSTAWGQLVATMHARLQLGGDVLLRIVSPRRDEPAAIVDADEHDAGFVASDVAPAIWQPGAARPHATGGEAVLGWLMARAGQSPVPAAELQTLAAVERDLVLAATSAGRARTDEVYAAGYATVFATLDELDARLGNDRYLSGDATPGIADLWVAAALLRFDLVFYGLYKCNRTRLIDFDQLPSYVRDVMQYAAADDAYDPVAIRQHHYWSEAQLNPKRLYPKSTGLDPWLPHDRGERFAPQDVSAEGTEENASTAARVGEWKRPVSAHRHRITADGASGFAAESGRYHLYLANNCPWCHRVALTRELKGLTQAISMDVLYYRRDPERGWQFAPDEPGCTADTLFGHRFIKELYERLGSTEKSVPLLYDRKTDTIVSNESAEIIRMLDTAFGAHALTGRVLFPAPLRARIEAVNAWVYRDINNGAYKAGFSDGQAAYARAHDRLFAAFARCDTMLADSPFLVGDTLTEADVRLFPTIFRFDPIYYTRFRLDLAMVQDYCHLSRWHDAMLAIPEVARASDLRHCKNGYFGRTGNNIVPLGPQARARAAPSPDRPRPGP